MSKDGKMTRDAKIAQLEAELAEARESLSNCQTSNREMMARERALKEEIDRLSAALKFADARINYLLEGTSTKVEVTTTYNIGSIPS